MEAKSKIGKKIIIISIISVLVVIAISAFAVLIYINSGYRTMTGNFSYKMDFYSREYEFYTPGNNLDVFQIKDLKKAEYDCYIYVGEYDKSQDLQETIDIVNKTDLSELKLEETTIGKGNYPARYVSITGENGEKGTIYFVDYEGKNLVISTQADDKHAKDINKMLESFTIIE